MPSQIHYCYPNRNMCTQLKQLYLMLLFDYSKKHEDTSLQKQYFTQVLKLQHLIHLFA
jgi:hypothetical protein